MYHESSLNQTLIFFYGIIFGIIMGIIYHILRIIRIIFKIQDWQTLILDIIYFFFNAVSTFLFALTFYYGQVRSFIIISEIIGISIYFLVIFTVKKFFDKKLKKIALKIKRPFTKIFNKLLNK